MSDEFSIEDLTRAIEGRESATSSAKERVFKIAELIRKEITCKLFGEDSEGNTSVNIKDDFNNRILSESDIEFKLDPIHHEYEIYVRCKISFSLDVMGSTYEITANVETHSYQDCSTTLLLKCPENYPVYLSSRRADIASEDSSSEISSAAKSIISMMTICARLTS